MRSAGKWNTFSRFEDEEGYQSNSLLPKQPVGNEYEHAGQNRYPGMDRSPNLCHVAVMAKEKYGVHWQLNNCNVPVPSRCRYRSCLGVFRSYILDVPFGKRLIFSFFPEHPRTPKQLDHNAREPISHNVSTRRSLPCTHACIQHSSKNTASIKQALFS